MNSASDRQSLLSRYLEGPGVLREAVAGLSDAELDAKPAAGGWTIREIVHHLADGDDLWKVGLKAAFGNEEGEFTLSWYWTMSQEEWVEMWGYARRSVEPSLALLEASRAHVAQILEQRPDGWNRSIAVRKKDGEIVRLSIGSVVEMQTNHVVHHAKRIAEIRRELGADP